MAVVSTCRMITGAKAMYLKRVLDIIWIVLLNLIISNNAIEICQADRFRASCQGDEVIVMTKAVYGRIRIGKCIKSDMGYLGCSSNVLSHFDKLCSNQKQCDVLVSNQNIPAETHCSELRNHLEAEYVCEKVSNVVCQNSNEIKISELTRITNSALASCAGNRVIIKAGIGQRLNVSLVDFNWHVTSRSSACRSSYGTVRDAMTSNAAEVCQDTRREKTLLLSNGNTVQFDFNIAAISKKQFLLQFSVLGCSDVTAPDGSWVRREADELVIGCTSGKHTWTLKCDGNQWTGVTGQCGSDLSALAISDESSQHWIYDISQGIIVFAFCSLLMFLASVIFLLGVCIRSNRVQRGTETYMEQFYTLSRPQAENSSTLLPKPESLNNKNMLNCN